MIRPGRRAQQPRYGQNEQAGQRERGNTPMLAKEGTGGRPASTAARIGRWQGQVNTASAPHR